MTDSEMDEADADIPLQAVEALKAATRRAIEAGMTIVTVRNGELIWMSPEGITILKKLPPCRKVISRIKMAKS